MGVCFKSGGGIDLAGGLYYSIGERNRDTKEESIKAFCGKNIVLTGCNSGIGLSFLKLIAKDNKVLCVDVNVDRLREMAARFDGLTVLQCDVSTKEGVDRVFDEAEKTLGKIDLFYANAGYAYYEKYNYADWNRIDAIFRCNCYSPFYSFSRYVASLKGAEGQFAVTASAIGKMAMPGYALYSASKFAVEGFRQALRLECPPNVKVSVLYPIATDTGFFAFGSDGRSRKEDRPFPVQSPDVVARKMLKAVAKGKHICNPSALFSFFLQAVKFCPWLRTVYWKLETAKFRRYCKREQI